MLILGNIFFGLATFFLLLIGMMNSSKPLGGGDGAMGYGLSLMLLVLCFALSSLMLTIVIILRGGFGWLSPAFGTRTVLMLLCWLLVLITTYCGAEFRWSWTPNSLYPAYLHWIGLVWGQIWIPMVWLVACWLTLHPGWQTILPPLAFKSSFWVCMSLSAVVSMGAAFGMSRESVQRIKISMAVQSADRQRWHQMNLDRIASQSPEDPLINLLIHSSGGQPADIRQAALAKISQHPNWEAELLDLLKNKHTYRHVYYFLDGNQVEYPEQFAQPLNQSLAWLAEYIRKNIQTDVTLSANSFDMVGIDNVLAAIDQHFPGRTGDFYSAVLQVQQALNSTPPERFKGVRFNVSGEVSAWLRAHKK